MTKKLNITAITNELEESAFFPGRKPSPLSPVPEQVAKVNQLEKTEHVAVKTSSQELKPPIPERTNARTDQRPGGKRIITRNSFEIYEDQMTALRTLSYQEKMEGKLGSMSGMVREAIDKYLLTRTSRTSRK